MPWNWSDNTINRLNLDILFAGCSLADLGSWLCQCWNVVWQHHCKFAHLLACRLFQKTSPLLRMQMRSPPPRTKNSKHVICIKKKIWLHNDCISMNIGAFCATSSNESMEENPRIPWSREVYWSTWSSKRCTADIYQNTKEKTGRYLRNWCWKTQIGFEFQPNRTMKGLKRKNDFLYWMKVFDLWIPSPKGE